MEAELLEAYVTYYSLKQLPGHVINQADKVCSMSKEVVSIRADALSQQAGAEVNGKVRNLR